MKSSVQISVLVAVCLMFVGCPEPSTSISGITIPTAPIMYRQKIIERSDGTVIVAGIQGQDHLVTAVCVDKDGTVQFSLEPANLYLGDDVEGKVPAVVTTSGDIVLAGNTQPSASKASNSMRLVRYSGAGDLISDTEYPLASSIGSVLGMVPGLSDDVVVAVNLDTCDWFSDLVIHIDAQGTATWSTTLDPDSPFDFDIDALATNAAGDVLVTGLNGAWVARVFKLSGATGATIWDQTFDNIYPESNVIAAAADGGAVFSVPPLGYAPVITRLDADGNVLWSRDDEIGPRVQTDEYDIRNIATDGEGNTVIVGLGIWYRDYMAGIITNVIDFPFVARLDPDGNVLWLRYLDINAQLPQAVTILNDGTYAISGLATRAQNGPLLNLVLMDPDTGAVIN